MNGGFLKGHLKENSTAFTHRIQGALLHKKQKFYQILSASTESCAKSGSQLCMMLLDLVLGGSEDNTNENEKTCGGVVNIANSCICS